MYFEVADITIAFWIPPLAGFLISLLSASSGVTGAFLLLPFQVSVLGFTSPAVSPTNQLFGVFATPLGIIRYIREKRMIWQLAFLMIAGIVPGMFVGTFIRLNFITNEVYFKAFMALVLLFISYRVVYTLLKKDTNCSIAEREFFITEAVRFHQNGVKSERVAPSKVISFNYKYLIYEFSHLSFRVPVVEFILFGIVVGITGGIYGIGGGALIATLCCSRFRLPVYTSAGPILVATFVCSLCGVFIYEFFSLFYPELSVSPDWKLGLMFGIGGLFGVYSASILQKYIPAKIIKWILASTIFIISMKYLNIHEIANIVINLFS